MTPLLDQYIGSRKLTPGTHRYKYPSKKMGTQLTTESLNECNFAELLEFDSRVKGFISQPQAILYDLYQVGHSYTADFLADFYLHKPTFYEIKPKGYNKSEEEEDKFYEIEKTLNDMGFDFVLVTGDYIEKGMRLKNFKKLRAHLRHTPDKYLTEKTHSLIIGENNHQISFSRLIDSLTKKHGIEESSAVVCIYQCLANKILGFDISLNELNESTMIGVWDESFDRTWNAVPIQE